MPHIVSNTKRLASAVLRKSVRRPGELILMCRMAWWIGAVSVLAQIWSLPRALQLVTGTTVSKEVSNRKDLHRYLAHTIDQVLSADVFVFRPKCWKRAAVLRRYLSKNGIPTTIVFGVRRDSKGDLDGHAWLEFEGQPLLENSPPDYVITYRYPTHQAIEPQVEILSQ